MAKAKKAEVLEAVRCDLWKAGLCGAVAATYCPRERAENCGPGECCHHPRFAAEEAKTRIVAACLQALRAKPAVLGAEGKLWTAVELLADAGLDLARWEARLSDPRALLKAYRAVREKRAKGG